MTQIRVLIVDDSPTLRSILRRTLETEHDIRVVGEASDPLEAKDAIKRLNPDVMTLDVEMPHMDGIEFLGRIMKLKPMPVVMVSTLTQRSTKATVKALELGAVECIGKPTNILKAGAFKELARAIRSAASAQAGTQARRPPPPSEPHTTYKAQRDNRIILIGASTGGVEAVFQILKSFPADCPPTLITQHIPANFSRSFAQRLDSNCAPTVCEAADGMKLERGQILVAPGGETHMCLGHPARPACLLKGGDRISGHRPSVDCLFDSALPFAKRVVAALLTGMGQDGAHGLLRLKQAGATTYAQDEATSVVYGMPRVAFELGATESPLPLRRIAQHLIEEPLIRTRTRSSG